MNSVHEPGSRTMSKNLTQEKYRVEPGQKQTECTQCTALASPRAQPALPTPSPRPPRAPAAPLARLLPPAPRAPRTPVCALRARPSRPAGAQRLLSSPAPHASVACCSGCIAIQHCPCPLPSHNTVNCIAIHPSLLPTFLLQDSRLYCNTNCPQPSLLQYNPAIQLSPLLYNTNQCIAIHFQPSSLLSLSFNTV